MEGAKPRSYWTVASPMGSFIAWRACAIARTQHRRVLRSRDAEAAGENEERHAADPDRLRLRDLLAHEVGVRAFRQELFDQPGVETAFAGDIDQDVAVADVASLDEIGLEQAVDDLSLHPR